MRKLAYNYIQSAALVTSFAMLVLNVDNQWFFWLMITLINLCGIIVEIQKQRKIDKEERLKNEQRNQRDQSKNPPVY